MSASPSSTRLSALDPRTPVLVGVGTASLPVDPVELMSRAAEAAGLDAGVPSLLAWVDRVAVPQGSWTLRDPARAIAQRVGARSAETHLYELGIPQQAIINDALAAITAGRSEVGLVVGGEARRWARGQAEGTTDSAGTDSDGTDSAGTDSAGTESTNADPANAGPANAGSTNAGSTNAGPDILHRRPGPLMEPVEVTHRLWEPVLQYAMIENALRFERALTPSQNRREVAELWARFNQVAASNPRAAFPVLMDADAIATAGPANRPLASPYNKWHASQWTVDQAAALLLCSLEAARRWVGSSDRWVFPLVGLESSHAVSLLRRRRPAAWPAMGVLGRAAAERIGRPVSEAAVVEVYSCFPSAVRVQQDELGLDPRSIPTVTGGMAFAGGPFNNFVLQAMEPVVERLRADRSSLGVVTTVSGLLTKPGLAVWGATPDGRPPLVADLAAGAQEATQVVEVVEELDGYRGDATVATYTVTFDGLDPSRTIAVCDTADGRRCAAISEDAALASFAVENELIGSRVTVTGGSFDLVGP